VGSVAIDEKIVRLRIQSLSKDYKKANMMTNEHVSAHALSTVPGIGAQKLDLLFKHFSSYQSAWESSSKQLLHSGLSQKLTNALIQARCDTSLQKEKELLDKNQITVIMYTDKYFPNTLKETEDHIPLLYVRGNPNILNQPSVAIVGSRKFSPYGQQAASRLAFDLAQAGVQIVSGLALGIDGLAHKGSIEACTIDESAGKTIAVLGGGIDDATIAPRTHLNLARSIIAAGGSLISTYPPGTSPNKGTFPARNAIMASLSKATLVIEAAKDSGTLITAQYAHERNKHVFAVPGSIFAPESVGTHELIASGKAKIMCQASDVLQTLNVNEKMPQQHKSSQVSAPQDPEHAKIFTVLQDNSSGLSIDKIIRLTTLKGATVSQALVIMEIDGIVMHLGGGMYSLK